MKEPMHLAVDRYRTACGVERKGKRTTRSKGLVDCERCQAALMLREMQALGARVSAQLRREDARFAARSGSPGRVEPWAGVTIEDQTPKT